MNDQQRRLAAILLTDMVGYSALIQTDEARALSLLEEHNRLLRGFFSRYEGREIKSTGDGFLVEFASVLQAVECAIAIQQGVNGRNQSQPLTQRFEIRIGIHLGDLEFRAGDVFGDGVNIVSRVEPLAAPGGICITRQVYDLVRNRLDVPLASIGTPPLKNIKTQIEIYRLILPWHAPDRFVGTRPAEARPAGMGSSVTVRPPGARTNDDRRSLAVLPFADLSPNGDHEYFADGITEELIDAFARVRGLKTISRTSVFALKGKHLDALEIGHRLGVDAVLEGSVRALGDRLRVNAQLINAADHGHLWSERYDREMGDVFEIQEGIARAIVDTLKPRLTKEGDGKLVDRPCCDPDAFNLYLKGRYFSGKGSGESYRRAIRYFEHALKIAPDYAPALAGQADAYVQLASQGHLLPDEGYPKARAAAEEALQFDDRVVEAHLAIAAVHQLYDWEWAKGEQSLRQAIGIEPGNALAHYSYSLYLQIMGRIDESIAEAERALDLDPLSLMINRHLGFVLYFGRRYSEAIAALEKTLELDPEYPITHEILGEAYLQSGDTEHAAAAFERETHPVFRLSGEALLHAMAGNKEEARTILDRVIAEYRTVAAYQVAQITSLLGETERSFEWLELARRQRDPGLTLLKVDPLLEGIRQDPRYHSLLERLHLAP